MHASSSLAELHGTFARPTTSTAPLVPSIT
jgi:hypothetical protein